MTDINPTAQLMLNEPEIHQIDNLLSDMEENWHEEMKILREFAEQNANESRLQFYEGNYPKEFLEEKQWLAELIRQSILDISKEVNWAVCFLVIAHQAILLMKLEIRFNPDQFRHVPSAFVYAMQ